MPGPFIGDSMKILALIVSLLILTGCDDNSTPLATSMSSNPTMKVDLLFEHDGCKVYHFEYNFHDHYYANCTPGMIENPQGKSQTDDAVPTASRG